jgi:hypothetical protein
MTPPPLVLVQWEDATILDSGPWTVAPEPGLPYTPRIFYQVGFLIGDQAEGIQLCEAWSDDVIAPRTQIPRGMIREIRSLRVEEKKRGKR